jgi:hypothetical protein
LEYFGSVDPHARQYSVIVQSLLKTTTAHVKKRENQERLQRKQASAELFGLLPSLSAQQPQDPPGEVAQNEQASQPTLSHGATTAASASDWTIYDADFFALPWPNENDQGLQDFLQPGTHNLDGGSVADIPLFPIYEQHMSGFD